MSDMKLLIIGSHGQVGSELVRQARLHTVVALNHDELDISDGAAVADAVDMIKPDVVINAAAYTAVDKAESDKELAFSVNCDGPMNLAIACAKKDILLLHYSTDCVFDGNKRESYIEGDHASPLGVCGASKFAGETMIASHCVKYLILRTSWVFSAYGHNFVKTMLKLGLKQEVINVVSDQFGKPTCASDIARLTLGMLVQSRDQRGIYHLAQPIAINWHGFAEAIFNEARQQGIKLAVKSVRAINSCEYPALAKRPANSVLNCEKLETAFGLYIRPWKESLAEVIREVRGV